MGVASYTSAPRLLEKSLPFTAPWQEPVRGEPSWRGRCPRCRFTAISREVLGGLAGDSAGRVASARLRQEDAQGRERGTPLRALRAVQAPQLGALSGRLAASGTHLRFWKGEKLQTVSIAWKVPERTVTSWQVNGKLQWQHLASSQHRFQTHVCEVTRDTPGPERSWALHEAVPAAQRP